MILKVTGNLEVKKVLCTHGGGITVTSKWNTDNILNTTLDVEVCLIYYDSKCLIPQIISGPCDEGIESEPGDGELIRSLEIPRDFKKGLMGGSLHRDSKTGNDREPRRLTPDPPSSTAVDARLAKSYGLGIP